MKTVLTGRTKEVIIDTNGPVVIIGESINPTRRKKLVSSLEAGDFEYVLELARIQINAMADSVWRSTHPTDFPFRFHGTIWPCGITNATIHAR